MRLRTSLQQRLVKIGGRLLKCAQYYGLLPAESHLTWQNTQRALQKESASVLVYNSKETGQRVAHLFKSF